MEKCCKVVRYTEEYHDSLVYYLRKTFKSYSDEYINYCIEHAIDNYYDRTAFIIINEKKDIVGCHMFFPTKALINNKVVETSWGHDTIVDEDYRKIISISFIVQINRIAAFGIGVTDANEKIQRSIKTRFLPGLRSIIRLNHYSCLFSLFSQKRIKSFKPPKQIRVNGLNLILAESSSQISILNEGFWCKSVCNVDFIRDRAYLEDRFFNNKVFKYYIYCLQGFPLYFVIRPIIFRGIPVLSLVDFRYDLSVKGLGDILLSAVLKISKKNHLGGILVVTNDNILIQRIKVGIYFSKEITLVANKNLKLKDDVYTFVTSADADVDFLRL